MVWWRILRIISITLLNSVVQSLLAFRLSCKHTRRIIQQPCDTGNWRIVFLVLSRGTHACSIGVSFSLLLSIKLCRSIQAHWLKHIPMLSLSVLWPKHRQPVFWTRATLVQETGYDGTARATTNEALSYTHMHTQNAQTGLRACALMRLFVCVQQEMEHHRQTTTMEGTAIR